MVAVALMVIKSPPASIWSQYHWTDNGQCLTGGINMQMTPLAIPEPSSNRVPAASNQSFWRRSRTFEAVRGVFEAYSRGGRANILSERILRPSAASPLAVGSPSPRCCYGPKLLWHCRRMSPPNGALRGTLMRPAVGSC